jgi:hypothetical protein
MGLAGLAVLAAIVPPRVAGGDLNADSEAQALLRRFQALHTAGVTLADDFNRDRERQTQGAVTFAPRPAALADSADRAVTFPEDRTAATYICYGGVIPSLGRLSMDFRPSEPMPRDYGFLTLLSAGTAGNLKFCIRLGLDRRITILVVTRRETLRLLGEPVATDQWHHLDWWFGQPGGVLVLDGVIQDYSTDVCLPYAVGEGEAFYLGDQPVWDAVGRQGVFYPLDSFVGCLDNLELVCLQPLLPKE